MPQLTHPVWENSKLPPLVLKKINRLNSSERREYLSTLISNYSLKLGNIDALAKQYAENWIDRQAEHLHTVVAELEAIEVLDQTQAYLSAKASFNGITDTTTTD